MRGKCAGRCCKPGIEGIDLCNECNLTLGKLEKRQSRFVNFYFHNLKGYDMHHILHCLAADDLDKEKLNVVPQNGEKFITFTWSPRTLPKEVIILISNGSRLRCVLRTLF